VASVIGTARFGRSQDGRYGITKDVILEYLRRGLSDEDSRQLAKRPRADSSVVLGLFASMPDAPRGGVAAGLSPFALDLVFPSPFGIQYMRGNVHRTRWLGVRLIESASQDHHYELR
jgi:hypothetical protein